jgi:hypothetical protein
MALKNEKMFTILCHKRNAILRIYLTSIRINTIKNTNDNKWQQMMVRMQEERNTHTLLVEM